MSYLLNTTLYQSMVSLAASDVSNVSNLSAISARYHDMSYVYQVYDDRKEQDGLVSPWDPPEPYHLVAFKDDRIYIHNVFRCGYRISIRHSARLGSI